MLNRRRPPPDHDFLSSQLSCVGPSDASEWQQKKLKREQEDEEEPAHPVLAEDEQRRKGEDQEQERRPGDVQRLRRPLSPS